METGGAWCCLFATGYPRDISCPNIIWWPCQSLLLIHLCLLSNGVKFCRLAWLEMAIGLSALLSSYWREMSINFLSNHIDEINRSVILLFLCSTKFAEFTYSENSKVPSGRACLAQLHHQLHELFEAVFFQTDLLQTTSLMKLLK